MKKITRECLMAFICVVLLCGCGTADASSLTIKRQGKKNAVEYVENKYGETPKVKKTKVEWGSYSSPGAFPSLSSIGPTGNLICVMELNGKSFDLLIEGDTKKYTGWDNYEYEDIRDAFAMDVSDKLNISFKDYMVAVNEPGWYHSDNLINAKFDDIGEFVNNSRVKMFVATTDYIDPELAIKYFETYPVTDEHALLSIYLFEYDDEMYIPDMETALLKDIVEDEHLKNYYRIICGTSDSLNNVEQNGEVISE